MAKRRSQLRLLLSVRSRVRQSSSRKMTSSTHPVQRLDAPVTTNRFGETLAAEITAEHVVPHIVCPATVGVDRVPNCVADGFDPRPLGLQREVFGKPSQIVGAFVDAAMSHIRINETLGVW